MTATQPSHDYQEPSPTVVAASMQSPLEQSSAAGVASVLASLDNVVEAGTAKHVEVPPSQLKLLLSTVEQLRADNRQLRQRLDETSGVASSVDRSKHADKPSAKNLDAGPDVNAFLADAIFAQSNDAILVLDDSQCVLANEVASRLLGCSSDDFLKANFYQLLSRKFSIDNEDWADSLLQQLATEGCVVCELRRDTPEGELWVELSLRAFKASGVPKVLVVGHDISRLRKFQTELARSHDFLHHTINSVQQPLSVKSADLKYVLANQAFCELVNLPFERIQGRTFSELVGVDARQASELDEEILESGKGSVNTEWLRRHDGSVTTLSTYRSRFYDPVTGAAFVVTASRDVTSELVTQRRLRLLASVFENAHESVAILGKDGTLHEANPEFIGSVGVLRDRLVGSSLKSYVDWGIASFDEVIQLATTGTPWFGHVKLLKGDADPVSCWLSLSPSRSNAGEITNLIAMFSDITQIESTRSELHRQTLHDNLTRLPNRRYYRQRITELIESDTNHTVRFGVSFLDLDDFKIVNDTLGHDAGDRLLVEASRRIRSQLSDDCFMARFGGDEFALLVPEIPGVKSRSHQYSARVVESLCEPFQLGEHEVNVGVSVGTTMYPDDGTDVESLMRQADVAMYRAKDEGKNKVRMFSRELVDVIERRQALLLDLKEAISLQQLHVVYQPKLDLTTGQVVGCESLLRWRREDGTTVSPSEFIPLAEESGLINRLGDQMFNDVCRQAKEWSDSGMLRGPIAVNLTQRQLRDPGMLERFIQAIKQHELQPDWLELEITENAIMSDLDCAKALMQKICDSGIRLAIDDFGTGCSSLAYIKDFPVQTLKLDNLFVDGLPDDSDAIAVAKTVLSLANGLNLRVVAEGVESEAQRDFLKSIGCDMIQGYLLSPPVEAMQYQQWLFAREG